MFGSGGAWPGAPALLRWIVACAGVQCIGRTAQARRRRQWITLAASRCLPPLPPATSRQLPLRWYI